MAGSMPFGRQGKVNAGARMKVVHICLSNIFVDGYSYRENELVREHVRSGHDVVVLCSTETYSEKGKFEYIAPGEYAGVEGARVIRLPYVSWLPQGIARKVRAHPGVRRILEQIQPDAILFHGTCGWAVSTVARYLRANERVLAYIDSHTDGYNSAKSAISRVILHGLFYKAIIKYSISAYRKVLCVSTEVMDFAEKIHGIDPLRLELFPLGGQVLDDLDYAVRRKRVREFYDVGCEDVLFVLTGRLSRRKRLRWGLEAFASNRDPRFKLLIAGVIDEDVRDEVSHLLGADSRVRYVGWCDSESLTDLLCAADIYFQPGTQSATMQHSLCCRCAVLLFDYPSHRTYFRCNGWLFADDEGLRRAMAEASFADLKGMSDSSLEVARELLDYRSLAKRVLRE